MNQTHDFCSAKCGFALLPETENTLTGTGGAPKYLGIVEFNHKYIMKLHYYSIAVSTAFFIAVLPAAAVISLTNNVAVSQNFDSLASTGTANTALPTGWVFSESGTGGNATYAAGTGSDNAGNTYSFGAASSSERAFGTLLSGNVVSSIGASFINNVGAGVGTIDVTISYVGEQWRLGATSRVDRLDFQYSTDATSITTGTWTDFNSLDFTAPVTSGTLGALVGNNAPNKTSISATITSLSVSPSATFWIRWSEFNATNADDGLAIDDFTITAIPEPNAAALIGSLGVLGLLRRRR